MFVECRSTIIEEEKFAKRKKIKREETVARWGLKIAGLSRVLMVLL